MSKVKRKSIITIVLIITVAITIPAVKYGIEKYTANKKAEAIYVVAENLIWEHDDFEQAKEMLETIEIDYKDKEPLIAYCQAKIDFYSGNVADAYFSKDEMIFSYQTSENLEKVGLFMEVIDDGYDEYLEEKYSSSKEETTTQKNSTSQYKPNNQYKPSYSYKPSYDDDPYDIDRYRNEEDFYYDNYENFIDYYEAEKYFKEHKK